MTRSEALAILKFLEATRGSGLAALGIEARDPVWMMSIALLRRHFDHQRITISALAEASGVGYGTALRQIERMIAHGLILRSREPAQPKLVYIEPTAALLENFQSHCRDLKAEIGRSFGLGPAGEPGFVFGGAHLAARIIGPPQNLARSLRLESPLRILVADEPTFLALARMSGAISSHLGTGAEIDVVGYDELLRALAANGRAARSGWDIVAVDAPWLGRLAAERGLLPLDGFLRRGSLNPFDTYAAAWELGRSGSCQYGLPIAPTAELLAYRADLFDKAGLPEPDSAERVVSAARRLHLPEAGRAGIAWNGARGQPLGQTFVQVMGAFGQPPVSLRRTGAGYDTGTPADELGPVLDTATGRQTLEYLAELAALSPPGIEHMDWRQRIRAFRSGAAAMCYTWSTHTMQIEEEGSPARGRTRYIGHPGPGPGEGISTMGGFVLAIPSNVALDRQRSAWTAMEWLAGPEMSKALIRNGSPAMFLHSVAADPEVPEVLPAMRVMSGLERAGQLQAWPRPPVPGMAALLQIVGEEVHDALWGGTAPGLALARAEARLAPHFAMPPRRRAARG